MTALSLLDLAPVPSGTAPAEALRRTVNLAQRAEELGYQRFWLAEHHGMAAIGSSSPEILIEHVASATKTIRVGSGGIMLPNHAPLRIAEAFQTLEALHPGRIDLGIGRAPGSDPVTSSALRPFDAEQFPDQLMELVALSSGSFPPGHPFHKVRVVPAGVPLPPIWLLGSSGASARLAANAGMGYSFASHFSPTPAAPAVRAYRENFRPSARFPRPHAILAVSVVCADNEAEAERLALTGQLSFVRVRRGEFEPLPSPEEALAYEYSPEDRAIAAAWRQLVLIGTAGTVKKRIEEMAASTEADEVMVMTLIHDPAARLRSYELIA